MILHYLNEYKAEYYQEMYRLITFNDQIESLKQLCISYLMREKSFRVIRRHVISDINILVNAIMKEVKKYKILQQVAIGNNFSYSELTETIAIKGEDILRKIVSNVENEVKSGRIDIIRFKKIINYLEQFDEVKVMTNYLIKSFNITQLQQNGVENSSN